MREGLLGQFPLAREQLDRVEKEGDGVEEGEEEADGVEETEEATDWDDRDCWEREEYAESERNARKASDSREDT